MSATPAQMHELLASSLSCLARLAMLGASPLADALQQAADREARDAAAVDHAEDQPSLRLGDEWKTMRQARKALDKISDRFVHYSSTLQQWYSIVAASVAAA